MGKTNRPYTRTCDKLIRYTIVTLKDGKMKFLDLTGKACRISKNSLSFFTRYPLQLGHVLAIRNQALDYSHAVIMRIRDLGGTYLAKAMLIRKNSPEPASSENGKPQQ